MIMLQVRKKVQEMQHATDGSDSSKADTTATHNSSTGEGSQEINHKGVENNKKDFVADKKNDNDEKSGVSSDSTQVISDSTQYSNGDSESRIKTSQANVTLSEITDGATQLNDKDTKGNTNVNIKSDQHGTTTSTNEVKADSTEGDDKANGDNTLNDDSDNSNENNDLKDEGIDNIFGVDDEHDNDDASEVVVDTNSYVLAAKKESDRFIRVNQELIEDMWVLYDKNKDGYLSKNECKTLFNEFLLRLKDFLPVLVSTAFQEKIERGKTKVHECECGCKYEC